MIESYMEETVFQIEILEQKLKYKYEKRKTNFCYRQKKFRKKH